MRFPVILLATLTLACAVRPSPGPAPSAGRDTSRLDNYAIRQMFPDSSEQVRLRAFFDTLSSYARSHAAAGNTLGDLLFLRRLAAQFRTSPAVQNFATQQIATYESFLGNDAEAVRLFDSLASDGETAAPRPPTLGLDSLRAEDAVEAIAALADTARAIFVNEAHHVPQHRAFTLALLERLKAKGFTFLAVETLSPFDSSLNQRGYPIHSSGVYSNEPVFGEMLRAARRLGYTLVPYEELGARSQGARELGMAANLRDRIFEGDPRAKVIVHAGWSHINESGQLAGAAPMAQRFHELTGIDPVTVNQTEMFAHSTPATESPDYGPAVARFGHSAPFVLRRPGGQLWSSRPGVVDITVFSPPPHLVDGRPDWLWHSENRRALAPPAAACAHVDPCVLSAQVEAESADAVPVDMVLHSHNAGAPLLLPAGRYRIVARDSLGGVRWDTTTMIRVN